MELVTQEILKSLETRRLTSRSKMRREPKGEKSSLKKGSSLEFSDYREYMQGDDIRNIDWNVYARTERLFLKLYFEEESKPVYFLVDASESMTYGSPAKFRYALAVAASLAYLCLRQYDQPRIVLLQGKNFRNFSFPSRQHFFSVLAQLDQQRATGTTCLDSVLKQITAAGWQPGIYFLLSDFYSSDGLDSMSLLAASNEFHCVQVLSPEELNPSLRGDLKLMDCESGATVDLSINPSVLKRYRFRMADLQDNIRRLLRSSAFNSFYCITTNIPIKDVLLLQFRRSGLIV